MKSKFLFLALLAGALLVSPGWSRAASAGRSDDERQIKKIEHQWVDAIVKRDAAYLQKIEAPDFAMIDPGGKLVSKEEDIKTTTGGDLAFKSIKIESLKLRFYGDTAIVNGSGKVQAHSKNEDLSGKYSWTDIFVKTNGEWKAVGAQITPVAPEKK